MKTDSTKILITVVNYSPNDIASHPARPTSSKHCHLNKNAVNPLIIYNDHDGTS